MYDTDCAGVIFFGSQFRFFHEAVEILFGKIGFPFKILFTTSPIVFVIVHAEADFLKPLEIGDHLEIQTALKHLGTTSIALSFTIFRKHEIVGKGEVVQVCLDAKSRKKQEIPAPLREALTKALG
jgi:1,4-dihydroxy-2-naphthoyl-CoA hydrolase